MWDIVTSYHILTTQNLKNHMKIRPTRSKTRIGTLNWLQKYNPFMPKQLIYDDPAFVAVHIHAITGAIVWYETADGRLLSPFRPSLAA